jgi:hypothetical protein
MFVFEQKLLLDVGFRSHACWFEAQLTCDVIRVVAEFIVDVAGVKAQLTCDPTPCLSGCGFSNRSHNGSRHTAKGAAVAF